MYSFFFIHGKVIGEHLTDFLSYRLDILSSTGMRQATYLLVFSCLSCFLQKLFNALDVHFAVNLLENLISLL